MQMPHSMHTTSHQTGPSRPRGQDWGSILTAALGLYTLAIVAWHLWHRSGTFDLLSATAALPLIAATVALALRAGARGDLDPAVRRAWRYFALAFALSLLGSSLGAYHGTMPGPKAWLWLSTLFALLRYPVMLLGILAFPGGPTGRANRIRSWLDTATVVICGWMITWYLLLGPASRAGATPPPGVLLPGIYAMSNLGLCFAATLLAIRRSREVGDRAPGFLAAGLFALFLGRLAAGSAQLSGWRTTTNWPDAIWAVGYFLVAVSANIQVRQARRRKGAGPARVTSGQELAYLPYLAIAVTYGLLLAGFRLAWHQVVLLVGALFVSLSVTIRQVAVVHQNTQLLQAAEELAEEVQRREARFTRLVQHSSDVIAVVEYDGRIRYMSPAIEMVLGRDPALLSDRQLADLVHEEDMAPLTAILERAGTARVQCRLGHADASWRHVEITVNNMLHDPDLDGIVLNIRDVSERVALEADMAHLAFHDSLTNLANRNLLRDRVAQALREYRERGEAVSVLFIDLDGFKTVNDSLGHTAGDQLLMQVAARLETCVRGDDIVARLGGDEFAVLLGGADSAVASRVAGQVIEVLGSPCSVMGKALYVYASVGIAVCLDAEMTAEDLLRNADVAMYAAKARGKGSFSVFEPSMHVAAMHRLELEADLRFAVGNEEFVVHYQPAVRLSTGRITGVEALVRWRHGKRGMVPPSEFIPLAEETELIIPLGKWVLWEACRQGAKWQQRYPVDPPLKISVNLSAKQLRSEDLVKDVAAALAEYRLAPGSLVLEVTESILMEFDGDTLQTLEGLKRLGVLLAIDDFGTGYSSLSYLRRFPADIVKIDRSFVDGVGTDDRDTALVRGIVELAHSVGLITVAEGIERPEQLAALTELNCKVGQGYFLGRPVDADQLTAILERTV
jgi:diguanylate cyclase (GGDEF)-like protein/PAS domain S-box-containing protein